MKIEFTINKSKELPRGAIPGLTFGFSRNHSARGFASKFNTAYQGGFFSRKIHV